jgi:hypothetical protein
VVQGWVTGEAESPMTVNAKPAPDRSKCFGHYRAQSPQYALTFCVSCPLLKSCVRTVWGLETPRRTRRRDWWQEGSRSLPLDGRLPAPPVAGDYAAT